MSGRRAASVLSSPSYFPAHVGHPVPRPRLRCKILACHSCGGLALHCHQIIAALPGVTSLGVSLFLIGCHCAARSGRNASSELDASTFCPAQIGQPFPLLRSPTAASHSWDAIFEQRHHTTFVLPAVTWSGVRPLFFVGCHSDANRGLWMDKAGSLVCFGRHFGQPRLSLILLLA